MRKKSTPVVPSVSFNVASDAFIHVSMLDGSYQELSLKDVILKADEIYEILGESPMVVAGLHRLVLAALYHIF